MPESVCQLKCFHLFAWGIFFGHVSCAVKMYCVWVIICHLEPGAQLTLQYHGYVAYSFFAQYLSSSLSLSRLYLTLLFFFPLLALSLYFIGKGDFRGCRLLGSFCLFTFAITFISKPFNQKITFVTFLPNLMAAFIHKRLKTSLAEDDFEEGLFNCAPKAAQHSVSCCNHLEFLFLDLILPIRVSSYCITLGWSVQTSVINLL